MKQHATSPPLLPRPPSHAGGGREGGRKGGTNGHRVRVRFVSFLPAGGPPAVAREGQKTSMQAEWKGEGDEGGEEGGEAGGGGG